MIKSMSINRELPLDKLASLTSRVDSIQKATIAELWVLGNNVITEQERCILLRDVYYKKSLCYAKLATTEANRSIPHVDHKIHIEGVKELKVG